MQVGVQRFVRECRKGDLEARRNTALGERHDCIACSEMAHGVSGRFPYDQDSDELVLERNDRNSAIALQDFVLSSIANICAQEGTLVED